MRRRLAVPGLLALAWGGLLGTHALLASRLAAGDAVTVALATGEGLLGVGLLLLLRLGLYLVLPPLSVFVVARALLPDRADELPSAASSLPPAA